MKIAFFGLRQAFDYYQIGGTESFVRRIANELMQCGNEINYLLYGDKINKELNHISGFTMRYFRSFDDALNTINRKYDHVVTIYLLPKDRIKYAFLRKKAKNFLTFHFVYFNWPDSPIKRKLYFSEARLFQYNGSLFCISKRQYEYVNKWAKNAVYLLPPVPEEFFLRPEEKPISDRIKITFLGRIDPGKGIDEVIEIFKVLKKHNNRLECSIYGIRVPGHEESFEVHTWLKNQQNFKYIEVDRQKYSPAVEEFVRNVLRETDIFIQPYQKLSSTIDTPLLLLEAMASLCAVVTKPFGNIPDIYGKTKFLIHPSNFITDAIQLLKNITSIDLIKERKRIYMQNFRLNFNTENVTKRFIDAINYRD